MRRMFWGEILIVGRRPADEDYACLPYDNPKRPGPSLRLSWPNAGDRRRAIVGKSMGPVRGEGSGKMHISKARIVHVSKQDMEMHYYLLARSAASGKEESEEDLESSRPVLQIPTAWCAANIQAGQQDLMQHCELPPSLAV